MAQAVLKKRTDLLRAHTDLARGRAQRRDFAGARREYIAAVDLFPVDWGLWIELGQACRMLGDRAGAQWAALHALDLDPANRDAQQMLAWAKAG
jgi:Flp pilus assembly protein TadD